MTMLFTRPAIGLRQTMHRSVFSTQALRTLVTYKKHYYIHPSEKHTSLISFSKNPENLPIGAFDHDNFTIDELSNLNADELIKLDETKFKQSHGFLEHLWKFLSKRVYDDYSYQLEAGEYHGSYMPVYDFRKIPEYGRRSEVDDVFGWVRVSGEGEMIRGSFEANNMYRVFTKNDGLPQLTDFLYENIEEITKPDY